MSFGGADNPFGGLELQPQGGSEPEHPPRPLDEIGAERAADLAAVQAELWQKNWQNVSRNIQMPI